MDLGFIADGVEEVAVASMGDLCELETMNLWP